MHGKDYIERILAYQPSDHPESPFLTAVGHLRHDKHDVAGMVSLAQEGLAKIDQDDPYFNTLKRINEYARSDKKYDHHDAKGILFLCNEALQNLDHPETSKVSP